MSIHVDLLEELPLLVFLDDETLARICRIAQVSAVSDGLLVDLPALVLSPRLRQLADELAAGPLPTHPEASGLSLRYLVTGLRTARGSVQVGDVPMRLFNLLGRHDALDYERLGDLRLSDLLLYWQNAGMKSARALLAEAIAVGLQSSLADHDSEGRPREADSDTVVLPEAESSSAASIPSDHPAIRDVCVPYEPSEAEIAIAVSALVGRLPRRSIEIVYRRLLALGRKPTLETLGQEMGLTRERVRQIERKAEQRILLEAARGKCAVLSCAARLLRSELGAVVRVDELALPWPFAAQPNGSLDLSLFTGLLLLWLAGPYVVRDEWLVRKEAGEHLEQRTLGVIDDHVVNGLADLSAILEALGDLDIRQPARRLWLQRVRPYIALDEKVVAWGDSLSDKAVAFLHYQGEPLTTEELASLIGEHVNPRSLKNQLLSDARVKRVGKLHFGLSDWEHDEYTTVSDEIAQEIERQGGEATLSHLVDMISRTYGVSESSIRAYAMTRRFVRTQRGTYRVASPDEIRADTRPIHLTRGCYRLDGCWSVRLKITGETLRGSGTTAPESFVALFGIRPDESKELTCDYGQVNVAWGFSSATLGSLRLVVEQLGGCEGDLLFVKAAGPDRLEFELVPRSAIGDLSSPSDLAALVAWGGLGPDAESFDCLRHALGFADSEAADPLGVATRLRARREPELLPLAEGRSSHVIGQSAVDEVLSLLGYDSGSEEEHD